MAKPRQGVELQNVLTRAALRKVAGPAYFSRGENYFDSGAVHSLRERKGIVHGTVHGTHAYKTALWPENGAVEGRCNCPLGRERAFCKHLVATGLTYLENRKSQRNGSRKAETAPLTPEDVEKWLKGLSMEELTETIMQQTDIDDEFYAALRLKAAASLSGRNTSEMRRVIRQTIGIDDFISWRETHAYTQAVGRVIGQLRQLLIGGHGAEVVELIEYALEVWEDSIGHIDDSDGCMGMIKDDLHQLHLEACKIAKPEPADLAERLFRRALESQWDMFLGAYEDYAEVFGSEGSRRYRELAESEWKKLPRLGPGDDDPERYGKSSILCGMMLTFAEEDGDLNRVIEILSRDLSHAYDFLRIAETCRNARKYKLAREWAERGLAEFPDNQDSRLRTFLADEYLRAKRPDDAIDMVWRNFADRMDLHTYEELKKYADKIKVWPEWREKATAAIRKDTVTLRKEAKKQRSSWFAAHVDNSLLVEIRLWESRPDEAWEEAQEGGCSERLWLRLAEYREKKHPEDAVEIYRPRIEPLVEHTNNHSYEQAVDLLGRIHDCMKRMKKEDEFQRYLTALKIEYKRKRNFIKFVERKKWGK